MNVELAKALVKFRGVAKTIGYDSQNPHFKSRFASLAAIHKAVDPWLNECGLTVMQFPINTEGGRGVGVRTIILHESGETIESNFFLPVMKDDPQSAGSSITYARRYALAGALGLVADEDDDANAASQARNDAVSKPSQRKPAREKSRKEPAMDASKRGQIKNAVDKRIQNVGSPDDTQSEVIAELCKSLGKSSAIELVDDDFDKAIEFIAGWETGGAAK